MRVHVREEIENGYEKILRANMDSCLTTCKCVRKMALGRAVTSEQWYEISSIILKYIVGKVHQRFGRISVDKLISNTHQEQNIALYVQRF